MNMDLETSLHSTDPDALLKALEHISTLQSEPSSSLLEAITSSLSTHSQYSDKICDTIAQLAKQENVRVWAASNGHLIPLLVSLMNSASTDVQLQALRAIGNLCFEQDECREQVHASGGCPLLARLLQSCSALSSSPESSRFTTVACGCLLNLCCENEKLSKALHEHGTLDHIQMILLMKEKDQATLQMGLKALSVLLDAECCDIGALSMSSLPTVLVHLLKESNEREVDVTEDVFELINETLFQGEKFSTIWKSTLAQESFIHQLLSITDPEYKAKVADILIQIVSEDASMDSVFQAGFVLDWVRQIVNSKDDNVSPKLKASAVLVVGNMARNESNCQTLYEMGIVREFLNLLETEEHVNVQFAVLSAIRNLSLPEAHKLPFLKDGIVEEVSAALRRSTDPNVIMKALGCLRLLSVTPEACQYLVVTKPSVERIVSAFDESSIPHIKTEASRLVASLVKNSSSQDIAVEVVRLGGTPCLLFLLSCEHALLVNEGLVALAILAALNNDAIFQRLVDSQCTDCVETVLKSLDDTKPRMIENCLVLLTSLCQSEVIRKQLSSSEELKRTLSRFEFHSNKSLKEKYDTLWGHLCNTQQ